MYLLNLMILSLLVQYAGERKVDLINLCEYIGSPGLYLESRRVVMFQLSGFYCLVCKKG